MMLVLTAFLRRYTCRAIILIAIHCILFFEVSCGQCSLPFLVSPLLRAFEEPHLKFFVHVHRLLIFAKSVYRLLYLCSTVKEQCLFSEEPTLFHQSHVFMIIASWLKRAVHARRNETWILVKYWTYMLACCIRDVTWWEINAFIYWTHDMG
jgi:hypothetical protein